MGATGRLALTQGPVTRRPAILGLHLNTPTHHVPSKPPDETRPKPSQALRARTQPWVGLTLTPRHKVPPSADSAGTPRRGGITARVAGHKRALPTVSVARNPPPFGGLKKRKPPGTTETGLQYCCAHV